MCLWIHQHPEKNEELVSFQIWSHYSCTTYKEQFNAEILNDKEKQEGCLQVKGDGEILRAEVHHISPKGRHTMVISSNPPMQQKAFQPWGKDN